MITQGNINNLNLIVSNLAMKDYLRFNSPGKKKIRKDGTFKHNPYILSDETNEARELLNLSRESEINKEDEEKIKAYLLNIMFVQPELLYDKDNFLKWYTTK